jgi:hypothetical protein
MKSSRKLKRKKNGKTSTRDMREWMRFHLQRPTVKKENRQRG